MALFGALGALAPIVTGVIGNAASSGDRDAAMNLQKQALAGLQGIQLPTLDQLKIDLQKYQLTGEMTPQLEATIQQNPSLMGSITIDPSLKQAQMGALAKLQGLGNGGFQPEDLVALAQIQQQSAGQANAQNASALQNMQQRGIAGSGAELASRLANAQGAANTQMQAGLNIQGQAAQRALQAIMNSGQLGGNIQGQDFAQKAQQAAAQDAINRFNAQNSQQVLGQNVGAQNQSQYYNLGQKQQLSNANTDLANRQQMYNTQLPQQLFNDAMEKQKLVYGGQQNLGNQYLENAANTQKMWSGIGSSLSKAGSSLESIGGMGGGKENGNDVQDSRNSGDHTPDSFYSSS